jgi:hypothetical protein
MKYLRSLLCLALVTFIANSSLAPADADNSVRLMMSKSDEHTAKVMIGSKTYLVPISFESGLSWDDVKDAYHVPPAYADLLKEDRISIYIDCSGASFSVLKHRASH